MNGEVKPFCWVTVLNCCVQGLAKELWVTVWLPPWNSKFIKSPTAAVMTWGLKTRPGAPEALAPTITVILAARAGTTLARAAMVAAANFILNLG